MFERYAVYVTPLGELARIGAAWLGWDLAKGAYVDHPHIKGVDVSAITATPRKYGLHGTIKPPFHLADGRTQAQLETDLAQLCDTLAPIELSGLRLGNLSGFLALTPEGDQTALGEMAAKVVVQLDNFRAPPTEAELVRRKQNPLSPAQDRHLADWGYPYVMDQFQFHITLTGRLDEAEATRVAITITPMFKPHLAKSFPVDGLTLVGQDGGGMFYEIQRFMLKG